MTTHDRRRNWVNEQFGDIVRGTSMTNKQKAKELKKLWKQAKRMIQ